MPRRYSASQIRSQLRQAQQKTRQAITKYNDAVRRHNQGVRTAINRYNQAARTHNERVRANRRRLANALSRLNSRPTTSTTRYVVYRTTVRTLQSSYSRLDSQELDARYNRLLDLSEREAANSAEVTNLILGDEETEPGVGDGLADAELLDGLRRISADLNNRWNGAVFSLNPNNPDAARHFCTSAREILTQILQLKALDADVVALLPDCQRTRDGRPTRQSRIRYFLTRRDMAAETLERFVEDDIENIVQLFSVFNKGTHGAAGTFDLPQLAAVRKRVEDGIMFLIEIIGDA